MQAQALQSFEKIERERSRRAGAKDILAFCGSVGVTPDPWQARVLTSTSKRICLVATRQGGKSTVAALSALHLCYYTANSLVLIVAPSERQSGETFRKVLEYLRQLPVQASLVKQNEHTIEFQNGSRIVALPSSEETVRGYSAVNLVILDEAGDLPNDMFTAILPMLMVSRGRLILQGTPKGRRGKFFEVYERGSAQWEKITVPWQLCPRIPQEDIAEARIALGEQFAQEYECSFISGGQGLVYSGFDEKINLIDSLPETQHPWAYLLGIDFGVTAATAFTVAAWRAHDPTLYIVRSCKQTGMSPTDAAEKVLDLQKSYAFSRMVADIGGLGKAFQVEMRRRFALPIEAAVKNDKHGHIALINGELRRSRVKIVQPLCLTLIQELTRLAWVDRGEGVKEDPGSPNHECDSFLYAWRASTAYLQKPYEAPAVPTREEEIRAWTNAHWETYERERDQRHREERYGAAYEQ
jgi:hypothetical protein